MLLVNIQCLSPMRTPGKDYENKICPQRGPVPSTGLEVPCELQLLFQAPLWSPQASWPDLYTEKPPLLSLPDKCSHFSCNASALGLFLRKIPSSGRTPPPQEDPPLPPQGGSLLLREDPSSGRTLSPQEDPLFLREAPFFLGKTPPQGDLLLRKAPSSGRPPSDYSVLSVPTVLCPHL